MRLEFGRFVLDEPHFELRRDDRPVPVQPKVLDLIFYLARHRERLVSKAELFREVWAGVVVTDAALSQAVRQARKVLDDTPEAHKVIRTVHGKGFRFVARVRQIVDAAEPGAPASSRRAVRPVNQRLFETTNPNMDVDTRDDAAATEAAAPVQTRSAAHLFVALHCDQPELGGARYSLEDLDELVCVRGAGRRAARDSGAISQRLVLSLPGHSVSREHARLVRTREGWFVVDNKSKNGTYLNGQRVERGRLSSGDVVECGRTLLLFEELPTPGEIAPDTQSQDLPREPYASLLPELQAKRHMLNRIARTDLPLLIRGETGTGKSRAARALHERSGRSGRFVALDCAELAPEQAIPRLFGDSGDPPPSALVRAAQAGTLCLEHVELLPLPAQAALARVITEHSIVPGGGASQRELDTRIVATTEVEIAERTERGVFNRELHALLAGFPLQLLPLRARRGDLGWLIAGWMEEMGRVLRFAPAAALLMLRYSWPNNLLELRQCLAAAAALAADGPILPEHFSSAIQTGA